MSCKRYHTALHDTYAECITPEESEWMVAHAAACPACDALTKAAAELTCRDFIGFLNEYVDGELPAERRDVFERHLSICPDCTAYLDSYQKTMDLTVAALRGRNIVPEEPPVDLVLAILRARTEGRAGSG